MISCRSATGQGAGRRARRDSPALWHTDDGVRRHAARVPDRTAPPESRSHKRVSAARTVARDTAMMSKVRVTTAPVVPSDPHLPAGRTAARRGDDRRRQRLRGTLVREPWRLDHGPKHVWAAARAVAGPRVEGLVGRQSAVPRAGVRSDAPCAPFVGDGGRSRRSCSAKASRCSKASTCQRSATA